VLASFLAGATTLALVWRRRFDAARFSAAVAVAAIIAGWALARWPTILPHLTVDGAAAGHDTLVWVVASVVVGGAVLFPSLGLLFRLDLMGRFQGAESTSWAASGRPRTSNPRLIARAAGGCLIAGIGLLTLADAGWAHAIGVLCLLGFMVAAFLAIVPRALADQTERLPASPSGPPRR
jgi:cytochrome d ubiquinol oxidase subunit II